MNIKLTNISFFIVACLISFNTIAGNDLTSGGGRFAGMGNAGVMTSDIWSLNQNQAGIAFLEKPTVGFSYENRFFVKELGNQSLAFALPTSNLGTIGVSLNYFGYSNYNESKLGIAYAKSFGDKFSIGMQFDYLNTHIADNYGSKGTAVAEVGIMAKPVEGLFIGAHVYNPTQSKLADYEDERIPTVFNVGLGYLFSKKVLVVFQTEKDLNESAVFKAGIEYLFLEKLYLRTGISTNPYQNSFGLGYIFKKFKADIAFTTHKDLGFSSQLSIQYAFGK